MKISQIIERVGGSKELQKLLGVSKSAISNYKKRNAFPDYAIPIIKNKLDNSSIVKNLLPTILLIICGGIAAYKAPEIIRKFKDKNFKIIPILTDGGEKFITPLTISTISEEKCFTNLFDLTLEAEMGHIKLSRLADIILVLPASANFIAKCANGFANDLANSVFLVSNAQKVLCPAMNPSMWQNQATQDNISILQKRGVIIINPEYGLSACGETGIGRLAKDSTIINKTFSIIESLSNKKSLNGKTVLVTSGPTIEPIDDVRFISNHSSGIQGHSIAQEFINEGAKVTLVTGPVNIPRPYGAKVIEVLTAEEMYNVCISSLPVDIAICAAAVSDWKTEKKTNGKIKKNNLKLLLKLSENKDILKSISNHLKRPKLVIGFAAETENIDFFAEKKLKEKNCDWILGNYVNVKTDTFGNQYNKIYFFSTKQKEVWDKMSKVEVAKKIVTNVITELEISQ